MVSRSMQIYLWRLRKLRGQKRRPTNPVLQKEISQGHTNRSRISATRPWILIPALQKVFLIYQAFSIKHVQLITSSHFLAKACDHWRGWISIFMKGYLYYRYFKRSYCRTTWYMGPKYPSSWWFRFKMPSLWPCNRVFSYSCEDYMKWCV